MLSVALSGAHLLSIASIVLGGGFLTTLVAIFKMRPERDSIIVSSAQGAVVIQQGLVVALREELKRSEGGYQTDLLRLTNELAELRIALRAEQQRSSILEEKLMNLDPNDLLH